MNTYLDLVIESIGRAHHHNLAGQGRNYMEVSIGKTAEQLGYPELKEEFRDAYAIVPLKAPVPGMKVRIDGRTFINYAQFASGVAVPGYVAGKSGLANSPYVPHDSMVLNFA
ncbi:MAG: hypothetical protein KGY42_08430 [Desulfobacterales bacterium]|nr:hypothetical protein [Desulfobacterales bacterium]MBS3755039.1 hypothetical protein [Desulfobacterales bacterium]